MRRLALHHTHLTISKMRKSCFPREGERPTKRVLAPSMSALLTGSRLSRRKLPGLLWSQPETGVGGPDNRSPIPGVPQDPVTAGSFEAPKDARSGKASPAASRAFLQRSVFPNQFRGYLAGKDGGGWLGKGAEEGVGRRAPKLQTAQLQLQVSGLSLEAIINLRFIFIGELESRLTLAKQGSLSRPWMRLNAGDYFCRKALQARLL